MERAAHRLDLLCLLTGRVGHLLVVLVVLPMMNIMMRVFVMMMRLITVLIFVMRMARMSRCTSSLHFSNFLQMDSGAHFVLLSDFAHARSVLQELFSVVAILAEILDHFRDTAVQVVEMRSLRMVHTQPAVTVYAFDAL